jgi:hypothetical protein
VIGLVGIVLVAPPALAEPDGEAAVYWSVAPADERGPDGRRWIELTLAPGEAVVERIAVTNRSGTAQVFQLAAADGRFTAKGSFSMLARPEDSVDAGTWIDAQDSVEVEPGQTVVIPFTVSVPVGAEPGDHAAGIAASVRSRGVTADGAASVGVTSRFGVRVMTRVLGDLVPGLEIGAAEAVYRQRWNPFKPGWAQVSFDLRNTGNARLTVTGRVTSASGGVDFPEPGEGVLELLPGETRRIGVALDGVRPLIRVSAVICADPVVVPLEGASAPALARVEAVASTWAAPWPQLATVVGVALICVAALAGRRRSRRGVAALISQARRAALAEALDGPAAAPDADGAPAAGSGLDGIGGGAS